VGEQREETSIREKKVSRLKEKLVLAPDVIEKEIGARRLPGGKILRHRNQLRGGFAAEEKLFGKKRGITGGVVI